MTVRKLGVLMCASLVLVVVGLIPVPAEAQRSRGLPACDPDNGGLILPEGFCALVVADGLEGARHVDVTADGDIYVHLRGSRGREPNPPGGGVVALRDADGDGRAEVVQRFSDHYGTGLQLRGDYLYLSTTTEVYRYRMTPGELVPRGEPELIVSGFPEQRGHAAKAFAFDESDNLYVNVGAPSNVCMENRGPGSPGQEPCPQRVRQASVWRFDADSAGQTQESDGHQFVTGIRNIVAIAWDPATRAIYAAQHGRDAVNTLWPDHYNEDANAELPSEELFRLTAGADFGWPFCYHDRFQGKKVLAPEYGGDGREVGRCADVGQPLVAFPAHWAPNDLLFYDGGQYPARFRDGVFVVFHGSWNRAPLEQAGYQVAFAPRADGEFTGRYETFAAGFAVISPLLSPQARSSVPSGSPRDPTGRSTSRPTWGGRCGGLCTEGCREWRQEQPGGLRRLSIGRIGRQPRRADPILASALLLIRRYNRPDTHLKPCPCSPAPPSVPTRSKPRSAPAAWARSIRPATPAWTAPSPSKRSPSTSPPIPI